MYITLTDDDPLVQTVREIFDHAPLDTPLNELYFACMINGYHFEQISKRLGQPFSKNELRIIRDRFNIKTLADLIEYLIHKKMRH